METYILEDVVPAWATIKKYKSPTTWRRFMEVAHKVEQALKRAGVDFVPAGSYAATIRMPERLWLTPRKNIDYMVEDLTEAARALSRVGRLLSPRELGVLIVRGPDGLYWTVPHPRTVFVDVDGFGVSLSPLKDDVFLHSEIGDPLIGRKVDTPTEWHPIAYKVLRGSPNDVKILTHLGFAGVLGEMLDKTWKTLEPYTALPKVRKRLLQIARKLRRAGIPEGDLLQELVEEGARRYKRFFEAYRHGLPVDRRGRPALPENERLIIHEGLRPYLRRI